MPGTILDPGDIAVEKTDLVGKTKKKKIIDEIMCFS